MNSMFLMVPVQTATFLYTGLIVWPL